MSVKVAVFGRQETVSKIENLLHTERDTEIVPFVYENESETVELFEKAFMCDFYLFTEKISYQFVKKKIEKKKLPAVQVPYDDQVFLTSLYHLKEKQDVKRISVDYHDEQIVQRVLQDVNLPKNQFFIYDYGLELEVSLESILSHHLKLWQEGKIDYVLTSAPSVEKELKAQNIPVIAMTIPAINLMQTIDELKTKIKLSQSTGAQVVTGYIELKQTGKKNEELESKMEKLSEILTEFCKKTDAAFFPTASNQYVLFGTKAVIKHLTNHYRDYPLLREIKATLECPVNIGYGLGLTAKQSEVHAKLALAACKESGSGHCFIINERQEKIGPIGVKKEFDASKLYQDLIHKARLNNELSYNFIDFIRSRNNEPFSSNDIAKFYNVTKRSAERTVNKLLSGNVIKVSGEERPYQKGRPRKLFTLNQ